MGRACAALVAACAAAFGPAFSAEPPSTEEPSADATPAAAVDFERDIRPIFAAHCGSCHGATKQEGGLRLNAREAAMAGGDSGQKAIVAGDPNASRLLRVVNGQDEELSMPPEGEGQPLDAAQIALVERWIREGAAWPETADGPTTKPDHWAWQKPVKATLPVIQHTDWPRRPLDDFVLARLEAAGLQPAPEADRHTLVRRVYLDLVGLPPTPGQVEAFASDARPDAYERMVDRALDDPGYGERWARVWLDLARYADSKGYGSDPLRTIWRYRDWVIDALNRNEPFDQFTVEQLAGDLLPHPSSDQLLATAFHRNTMANDEGGTDDEEFRVAAVKDRIETTMQVWMGLTMGCAKCHSHKFDPITQREYYQGYAFFDQTEDADRGDEEPKLATPTRLQKQQLADCRARIAALNGQLAAPPAEFVAQVPAWEQSVCDADAAWVVLPPQTATATSGSQLEVLADHSIRAGGAPSENETYDVGFTADLAGISALRLEVLGDDALPEGGPGRGEHGAFVLNEVRLTAGPVDGAPPSGRFVRIELPGAKRMLSLAEVQVFAGDANLAPGGKARQSSTAFDGRPELAIDKNTDGDYQKKSVTHTSEESDPWWEVDLGRTAAVERVAIWNRTDGGLEARLVPMRLLVLDESRQPLRQRTLVEPPKPSVEVKLAEPTEVAWAEATADAEQHDFPVAKAIDGSDKPESGWSSGLGGGKPRVAVFRTRQPIAAATPGPMALRLALVQTKAGQTIGRFRVSVTMAASPPKAIPADVREALAVAPESRSEAAREALAAYAWSQSPDSEALRGQIVALESQVKEIEKEIPSTPILRELPESNRRVTHTMVKGNFRATGDEVTPAVPSAFHAWPEGTPRDRLGLARWLVARDNPLTARVTVNRLWAQLFSVGIVATEEDFGTQGLPPTHPQLLDWLAVDFMDGGWNMKAILREIVCSATYRQSSTPAADALAKDPNNQLLAHGPRQRLEAEMVRDQALAISGLLAQAGRPVRLSAAAAGTMAGRVQRPTHVGDQFGRGSLSTRAVHVLAAHGPLPFHGGLRRAEPRDLHAAPRVDQHAAAGVRDAQRSGVRRSGPGAGAARHGRGRSERRGAGRLCVAAGAGAASGRAAGRAAGRAVSQRAGTLSR